MILVEILESLNPGLGFGCKSAQWCTVPIRADLSLLAGQQGTADQNHRRSSPEQQQRLSWARSMHGVNCGGCVLHPGSRRVSHDVHGVIIDLEACSGGLADILQHLADWYIAEL